MNDHPCAAGDLCKAPPTADKPSSRHLCCKCKKAVHSVHCSQECAAITNTKLKQRFDSCEQQGNFKEVCFSCLEKERRVLILPNQYMRATKSGEDSGRDSNSDSDSNSGGNCGKDDGNNSGNNGDDENNNNIATASKRDSVDPWMDEVTFDELKNYDANILHAKKYYVAGDRDTWKPVILTAMSIGVAGFPEPEKFKEVEEIANVLKRNTHAYLCPHTSVDPTTRKAVPFLKKEVIRRAITNKVNPVPRISGWNLKKCKEWLQNNLPHSTEHEYIRTCYRELLDEFREHYLLNSGSTEANMFRLLRAFECLLHKDLQPKFITRNDQLSRHQIDGRNSPLRPKTLYEDAAVMYNSNVVLYSRNLSERYGEPFHRSVALLPVTENHRMTAETMKKIMTGRFRGSIISIHESFCVSGGGDGAREGSSLKDFVTGPKAKATVSANGDITGYFYAALEEEGILHEYMNVVSDDVAASMTNVPRINSKKKKNKKRSSTSNSSSSGKKKRGRRSEWDEDGEDGIGAISLLRRMETKSSVGEAHARVSSIRSQITHDESTIPDFMRQKLSVYRELKPFQRRVNEGTLEEDDDDWMEYEMINEQFKECEETITKLKRRIKDLYDELQLCTKELKDATQAANSLKDISSEGEIVMKRDYKYGDNNDSVATGASNDGSRELTNNEIPTSKSNFSEDSDSDN